jgi:CHAT domain
MPAPTRRPIELQPGTPVADAVIRARAAFARADAAGFDAAYQQAVGLAAGDPALWPALATNHAEGLRKLGRVTLALQRCTEYVDVGPSHLSLRLLRAQIRSAVGDHRGAGADALAIRSALAGQSHGLTQDDSARLHRVQGLAAADSGDLDKAVNHLDAARRDFLEAGNQTGAAAIELDRLQIEVWQGNESAVSDVLSGEPPQTVSDCLLLAVALRRQLRYEAAFLVLWRGVDHDIDPALGWHVWYELILLLRLMRQHELAQRLFPSLRAAATVSADPMAAAEEMTRLSAAGASSDALSPRFDRRVQHARRLITEARLEEAKLLLDELHPLARTDRDISTWHLAAGELELSRPKPAGQRSCVQAAVGHLTEAVARAWAAALVEVRVCALRSLGHAFDRLDADERAAECWAEAHRLEQGIAGRQISDEVRIGMLEAVPNEYDERIRAAARKLNDRGPEGTAAIVVAMEAARGAMILERILPAEASLTRDLPRPSDLDSAWRWVSAVADRLPPAQAAWISHSTPDRVHHAVVGRGLLYYKSVPSQRNKLTDAIDDLMACWDSAKTLEASITGGDFDESLKEIAARIGIDAVISELRHHPQVRRIAIVAGGELSDIPFAALTVTGETEPLGVRFALSDLPCLSARLPLHRRSLRLRGDRLLLVRPPADGLCPVPGRRTHTVLNGARATSATLQAELELHRHHQVRIDSHGQHDHHHPTKSWLQLAPEGPDGQLRPEDLQWMDLRGCGTFVLGACESGMAQRTGRDERIGFVRAAVHAGAAAVIAARWRAEDSVAAAVLNRFERNVGYLPRDLALQQAQLDVYRRAPGTPVDLPAIDHPARWACWTLYGDSGWQTRASIVRRLLRRGLAQRRHRVARV